jgi:hypothetical protein
MCTTDAHVVQLRKKLTDAEQMAATAIREKEALLKPEAAGVSGAHLQLRHCLDSSAGGL